MAAGPVITGYVDVRRIGRGGIGDVYRARDERTGAAVAIKVLRDVSDTSVAWHRARREMSALMALSGHANVVSVVDVLDLADGPALVMALAPGGSVADLLDREGGVLGVDATVFIGRQTAAALVSAHQRGIVHRDIKPQNLLIDAAGQVQLCDFGIAALTRDAEYRDRTNAVSMRYASPEDLEHDVEVGPAADVYSLGATLLHLAHGAPPTLRERLAPWDPPEVDDPRLAALDRVIARCLHPLPALRPTAQALVDALDGLALGAGDTRVTALPVVTPSAVGDDSDDDNGVDTITDARASDPADDGLARVLDPLDQPVVRPPGVDALPRPPHDAAHRSPHAARVALLSAFGIVVAIVVAVIVWPADGAQAPTVSTSAASAGPVVTTPIPIPTSPAPTASIGAVPLDTLPRPPELPPLDAVDWRVGDVGDCLVQVGVEEALQVVDCLDAHDLQRLGAGSIDDVPGLSDLEAFDAVTIENAVTTQCAAAFAEFVGRGPFVSQLDLVVTKPSEASWAQGDRDYGCYGGKEGYRIAGDARNSGW